MADLAGRKLGDYTLGEKVGDGGHGDVYRAEHRLLKRVAVVKVLNEARQCADNAEARFLREAQLASKLRHAYAAQVYDFGVAKEDGRCWFAMEFVDGVTLAHWLTAHGPMSLGELVPFAERLAEVIDVTHQCGIVHRDLKPSNVMVIKSKRGKLIPKLLDFGIAKGLVFAEDEEQPVVPGDKVVTTLVRAAPSPWRREPTEPLPFAPGFVPVPEHQRRLTPPGVGFGSRPYMSPEQWCNASSVGSASDIYSLGVMLYEVLTGRRPSTAMSTDGLSCQHQHALPERGLSPELEHVFHRALATDPQHRHANALELAAELRAVLQADPNEQIRSLTRRWQERGRSPDLLARGQTLVELKRSVQSLRVAANLSEQDDSFITMSLRRARRARWGVGALVALVVMSVLLVQAEVRVRMADRFAVKSEVERGQQALLHGEFSEAVTYLEQAYQDGERSPGLKFMLSRALQPRLSESARFASSSGRMWSAQFTPDGKRVLTTDDEGARMWDASSSQLLFTMDHGGDTVYGAVFSPEGSKIVTAGADGTVRIWSAATGAPIRELKYQRPSVKLWRYYAVAMSSHFVAAIDVTGKSVHVWVADTGQQIAELANDAPGTALLAFSADGRWLATSGRDEVRVFNTSSWRQVVTIAGPRVRSLSFDATGPRLAVGTNDGVAAIWEIPSGERVRGLRDAGASVDTVAFSHDGALVAAASRDGMEQVWDVSSGSLRTQFNSHRDRIYAVEFSSTGNLILSAGAEGAVVVSNVATGIPVARLEGPKGLVITAHFDPESRRVVGASWDGTSRVWDAASPYRRWGSPQIGAECDTAESLVPDQRFIALSCRDHGTHVWDTARGELVTELPSVTTADGNNASAFQR